MAIARSTRRWCAWLRTLPCATPSSTVRATSAPSITTPPPPTLLANGASGIAVGMATNIPPHNLGELCDAIACLIDNPDAGTEELTDIVKGPDFPTGGVIFRYATVRLPATDGQAPTSEKRDAFRAAYAEGKGRGVMRARVHIEEMGKGNRYQ